MPDRLALYNGALLRLKERELDSLTENQPARHYLDQVWAQGGVDELLAAGQWKHARRTVQLTHDADLEPLFGGSFAARRPDDWVRTIGVYSDEFMTEPYLGNAMEGDIIYFGMEPLFYSYISNHATLGGGNLAGWPALFFVFAKLYFASLILPRLTGNKTDAELLAKDLKKARKEAKSVDAMESPTSFAPRGSWARARTAGGSNGWRDRGSRSRLIG